MVNFDWEKTSVRWCHTTAPNRNKGYMRRKGFCSPQSDKRAGRILAKLRTWSSGEWASSPNNTRWTLAVIHLAQGALGLTRWQAARVGLSVQDKTEVNGPNAIITKGGKSSDRVGNPVIQLERFVEVVRDSQLAQRSSSSTSATPPVSRTWLLMEQSTSMHLLKRVTQVQNDKGAMHGNGKLTHV